MAGWSEFDGNWRIVANVLFVLGPTASGKTDLAFEIASRAGAEVISADSVQFYRELVIGSARPSLEQLNAIRHHFVGHVSIAEDYTAGSFERDALSLINDNPKRSFVVCGGSGFYVQALQYGMYPIEKANLETQKKIEADIEMRGLADVYEEFKRLDPEAAERVSAQDRYRIVRSLEILYSLQGRKLSDVKRQFESSRKHRFPKREIFNFVIQASREELMPRVQRRTQTMLTAGLVEEVRALMASGFSDRPAMHSVGYKETVEFLKSKNGQHSSQEGLAQGIVQGTLRLAKKQRTWFSRLHESTDFLRLSDLNESGAREVWLRKAAEFLTGEL